MLGGLAELEIKASDEQFDLNPYNNQVRVENSEAVMATDEVLALDIDESGLVDFADFLALSANFRKTDASHSEVTLMVTAK